MNELNEGMNFGNDQWWILHSRQVDMTSDSFKTIKQECSFNFVFLVTKAFVTVPDTGLVFSLLVMYCILAAVTVPIICLFV